MIPLRGWKSNLIGRINPRQQGRFHTQEFETQSSDRCKYITGMKNSHTEKGLIINPKRGYYELANTNIF